MTFTVFGTGAVGGYYGGRLAEAGQKVHFLARSDYKAMKEQGLQVLSCRGDFHIKSPLVYNNVKHIPETDVVLLSLKTTENHQLKDQISPLIHKNTTILILQNGLGMEEEIQSWFPENRILGGMCFICSQKKSPAVVEHMDKGLITLGCLSKNDSVLRDDIARIMESSGIPVTIVEDLGEARWRKLLWNIPYNGLSVALNKNTYEIMDNAHARSMVKSLMKDVIKGAEACGFLIEAEAMEKMLHFTSIMTPYEPSMKLDYLAERPMEIEYLYDRPLEEALGNGYEMNSVKFLRDQLKFIQANYHEQGL